MKAHIIGASAYLGGKEGANSNKDENWDNISEVSEPDNFEDCTLREEFIFENGSKYEGQWKGEMRHGKGKQQW